MIFLRLLMCVLFLGSAYGTDCVDEWEWCENLTQFCDNDENMIKSCRKTCNKCFTTEPDVDPGGNNEGDDSEPTIPPPSTVTSRTCTNLRCEYSCIGNRCTCQKGYRLRDDKISCKDVNECIEGTPCGTNQRCINTEGSYICADRCSSAETTYYNSGKCCRLSKDQCGKNSQNNIMLARRPEETIVTRWPWASLITIKPYDRHCGGILVSKFWVLAAAHCLGKANPRNVYAFFGIINTEKNEFTKYSEKRRMNRIIIHSEYSYPLNDLAMMRVAREVKVTSYVGIVCMPHFEHPPVGHQCWEIGYGKQGLDPITKWLQQETHTVVDKNKCTSDSVKLDHTMACLERKNGEKLKKCGDFSGGPLVCQRCSSCDWYVAGFVPSDAGCPTQKNITSFTSVSVHESWIRKIMGLKTLDKENHAESCQPSYAGSRAVKSWNSWSNWSECSATCGDGIITRKRSCKRGNPGEPGCVGNTEEEMTCSAEPCSGWGEYNNWSECSRTCRGGTRYRSRECINGKVGSKICKGSKRQKEKCNVLPCAKWGRWEKWQTCSVTCGKGTQISQRECENGKIGDKGCIGKQTRNRSCRKPTCPSWSNWGSWSKCSASCGEGVEQATRTCMAEKKSASICHGNSTITRPCVLEKCQAEWTTWSEWSNCSKACDGGESIRTRQCPVTDGEKECYGLSKMAKVCNTDRCKPESSWSQWGHWSKCDAQCGKGRTRRERECESTRCPGRPFQVKDCFVECHEPCSEHVDTIPFCSANVALCGIHILWGRCDKTCCLEEYRYAFSEWSSWSSCSKRCGGGLQTRKRYCYAPLSCRKFHAKLVEDRRCNEQRCSARYLQMCSATCGGGIRQKRIVCDGINCKDNQGYTMEPCNTQPCPSSLASWNAWSQCSETCGEGSRKRERTCLKDYSSCSGVQVDIEKCKLQECNGTWSEWRQWGFCSVKCGIGTIRRSRICLEGACAGPDYQEETCVTFDCPLETSTCEDQATMQYLCPMLTNYCDNAYVKYACRKSCKLC